MLLAQLYCLIHGIRFRLYSKGASFSSGLGWTEYFEPFCRESSSRFHQRYNVRCIGKSRVWDGYRMVRSLFALPMLTQDLWSKLRVPNDGPFDIEELGWSGLTLREALKRLLYMDWQYTEATKNSVDSLIFALPLSQPYIGFHIRGGDKSIEYPLVEARRYIEKAESITNIRRGFVLTDDYAIFHHLCTSYPHWFFFTLCQPSERGYFHKDLLKQSGDFIHEKHLKLFASVDVLAQSENFIGTFSSNPGMYMGLRMASEQCYGVDFNEWKVW